MRILIHSNAPWVATGYGNQTDKLIKIFKSLGHEVAVSAFYGLAGREIVMNGVKVYPGGIEPYGTDVIAHYARNFKADIVITLIDNWVMNNGRNRWWEGLRWIPWAPVDHDPLPPPVYSSLADKDGKLVPYKLLAYSKHGQQAYGRCGLKADYIPHCIDTDDDYYPAVDEQGAYIARATVREQLGLPIASDAFMVTMVAANKGTPSRKGFAEAIEGFGRFFDKHRNAVLYLHTEATGAYQGVSIPELRGQIHAMLMSEGLVGLPRGAVIVCDQDQYKMSFPTDYMRAIYNASDVLLSPSYGEGFGIPIAEAQACGTPVIVTDWTAMTELCHSGYKVDGQRMYDVQGSWYKVPSVKGIVKGLEWAFTMRGAKAVRDQAVKGIRDEYSLKAVTPLWKEYLDGIKADIDGAGAVSKLPSVLEALSSE